MTEYKHYICTHFLDRRLLWEQLEFLLALLRKHELLEVRVLFGAGWGNWIYPDPVWKWLCIPVDGVAKRIKKEEENGNGEFGDHDLFITHPSIDCEILFSHESDIDVSFNEASSLTDEIAGVWKAAGLLRGMR